MTTTGLMSTVKARRGHFQLESGHHGDLWLDLESLCVKPSAIRPYAAELAQRLQRYAVDAVCGPLNEGAFVALMIAGELDCQFTYAERFAQPDRGTLYPVEYRLPVALHHAVHGRRVAIVNDVISAGSAVRGALTDLDRLGAQVVVVGALLVFGPSFIDFATRRGLPIETLSELPYNLWPPDECPLCKSGVPLENASV